MDINRAVHEYQKFYDNYNKGQMFKIRNIMRQLSKEIVNTLNSNVNDDLIHLPANECNAYNTRMNEMNDEYNRQKEIYDKIVDSYFPYTKSNIPKMMPLLHDDKFNYFDINVYRDVLNTYNNLTTGKTSYETTTQKVNDKVKKAFNV